jgi:hypothetical protein
MLSLAWTESVFGRKVSDKCRACDRPCLPVASWMLYSVRRESLDELHVKAAGWGDVTWCVEGRSEVDVL